MKKRIILLTGIALLTVGAKKPKPLPAAQPMTASDKQTGSKAHPEILKEFGGLYQARQADYVRTVGQKIAVQSGLSNAQGDFTISLLNSSVNNAFAVPGGYVYVTRQLMGLMNSEAELASVLGHEVGHVAARHAQKRNQRSTIGGLGAMAATILGGVLAGSQGAQLGQQLGGSLATRWVLGYSRDQEYQADDLGVTYLAKAGYDPMASSTMLAALASQTSLDARVQGQEGKSLPEWASTHPDPASRVTRAAGKAQAAAAKTKTLNRDSFLAALDGMLYGDDPKQGVVEGRDFLHPDLKLAFTAPAGFAVVNGSDAVTISGSTGQAQFGGAAYNGSLTDYIAAVFKAVAGDSAAALNTGNATRTTINGLPAAYQTAQANSNSGPVKVTVYAYEFGPNQAFHILSIVPAASGDVFSSLNQSVRRLSAQEAAGVKPRELDIVTVRSGDTVEKMAARMAYSDYRTERFLTLNSLTAGASLKPGQKVKIVIRSN